MATTATTALPDACPCGAGRFAQCCGRYLTQGETAPSAALLMRSRYSAFVLRDEAYLRASWHPRTCPPAPLVNDEPDLKWLGLAIKHHSEAADGDHATVEFVARYKMKGRAHRLHEVSRFVREQGRWYYVDGDFPE
jgi:SEC-C motif-containing protein